MSRRWAPAGPLAMPFSPHRGMRRGKQPIGDAGRERRGRPRGRIPADRQVGLPSDTPCSGQGTPSRFRRRRKTPRRTIPPSGLAGLVRRLNREPDEPFRHSQVRLRRIPWVPIFTCAPKCITIRTSPGRCSGFLSWQRSKGSIGHSPQTAQRTAHARHRTPGQRAYSRAGDPPDRGGRRKHRRHHSGPRAGPG